MKFENLSKSYDHRGIAGVAPVSFEIADAEVFALLGPNGSGKTTFLHLLRERFPQEIAYFTETSLPEDLNVQDFLVQSAPRELEEEKKIQLARDYASLFEFTFQLRQKTHQLSAGQTQKVLLSAALLKKPKLLLLDEPFNRLDPLTRRDILQQLFEVLKQQAQAVVWVTHDTDEALLFADRIGLLNHGRFEQISKPLEFVKNPKNIFVAQFLGHQNFVTVVNQGTTWKTPWGDWQTAKTIEGEEGYMVIPPHAWDLKTEGPLKVLRKILRPHDLLLQVERENRLFWVAAPFAYESETKIELTPIFEHCLLLPL
jgi:iron(III) transport system ATP-binding protein